MPNIATLLKNEISRVARKEQRGESLALEEGAEQPPLGHRRAEAAQSRRWSRRCVA